MHTPEPLQSRMASAFEQLLERLGPRYILAMMILTRLAGTAGGLMVIFYVELTLKLPDIIRFHFRIGSLAVVAVAVTLVMFVALWETQYLRRVLGRLRRGEAPDPEEAVAAGREAATFASRHHRIEAWLVPCSTLAPLLVFLKVMDDASPAILMNVSLAAFMAIAMTLLSTFFAVEYCMQPVIRHLLNHGVPIDYDRLPKSRLQFRFRLCFTLIIMTTAMMIGTQARQRAADIIELKDEDGAATAVAELKAHSTYITFAAVLTGMVFSTMLAKSVASRADRLVKVMERVGDGHLSERVQPTGNDEIDQLGRQFNAMVERLEHSHQTIQDLNLNLEQKVRRRTQELEEALQRLRDTQTQLTDLAHRAGMAEIATGVLHNVGNVLNSLNVSAACLEDRLRRSKLNELRRFTDQLAERRGRLHEFFSAEERGEKLLDYLTKLCEKLESEQQDAEEELGCVAEKIGVIRGIISTQQSYARRVRFREQVDVAGLIEEVLTLDAPLIAKHDVKVVTDFQDRPAACLEKSNLVQVFENLIKNAVESMGEFSSPERTLTVRLEHCDADRARVTITDTGRGIAPEHLEKIFTYGFTTKTNGSGFGLHSSALAVAGIGGEIHVHSDGVNRGATFTVEFPLIAEDETQVEPDQTASPELVESLAT